MHTAIYLALQFLPWSAARYYYNIILHATFVRSAKNLQLGQNEYCLVGRDAAVSRRKLTILSAETAFCIVRAEKTLVIFCQTIRRHV
jgi:hypothetical protein